MIIFAFISKLLVDAALTAGDYDFSISKGNRELERLFIQDEMLMTEFRLVFLGNVTFSILI